MDKNKKNTLKLLGNLCQDTLSNPPDNIVILYQREHVTSMTINSRRECIKNYAAAMVEEMPDFAEKLMVAISTELQRKEIEK